MHNRHKPIFLIIAILVICGLGLSLKGPFFKKTPDHFSLSGWITYFDYQDSFQSFKDNVDYLDEVNPFVYAFNPDGAIVRVDRIAENVYADIITLSRETKVRILPAITNDVIRSPQHGGNLQKDPAIVHNLLRDNSSMKEHINAILAVVMKDGVDGIEIDYESLNAEDKGRFIEFIELLSKALHDNKKLLNITLAAGDLQPPKLFFRADELLRFARCADTIKIMCYNLHGPFSQPGPVSTAEWVEKALKALVHRIPRDKICIALPLHGFDWSGQQVDRLTYKGAMELLEKYPSAIERNEEGIPHFIYFKDGNRHEVWFEDEKSIINKIEIIRRYGIGKIALWRLGGESDGIYRNIKTYIRCRS